MKKRNLLVGVILVVIVAIGLGIYFVQRQKTAPKSYKSKDTGIEIEYPNSFDKVEEESISSDEELEQIDSLFNINSSEIILQSENKEIITMVSGKITGEYSEILERDKDEKLVLQKVQEDTEQSFNALEEILGSKPNVFSNEIKTINGKQVLDLVFETEGIKTRMLTLIKDERFVNILYVAALGEYNDQNAKAVENVKF